MVFVKKYPTLLFLTLLFCIGFFLRFYLLPSHLFFGPEQGTDFLVIRDIAYHHKLTLIGPKTDIQGIFHGPLYYYFSLPAVYLSHGNPIAVGAFFVLLNALTVYFLFLAGKELFNQRVGLLASIFFTFSYEAIIAARWLSSQPLALPLVSLLFYFLARFGKGHQKALIGVAICFGLISQVQFLNFILFSLLLFVLGIICWKKLLHTSKKIFFVSACLFGLLPTANFFAFDIRHQFLISKNILNLFTHHTGYYLTVGEIIASFQRVFLNHVVVNTLFPLQTYVSTLLFLVCLLFLAIGRWKAQKRCEVILFVWLLLPFLFFLVLKHEILTHYFLPLLPALLLLLAYTVDVLWKKTYLLGIGCIALFIILHLHFYLTNIPQNTNIFFQSTQEKLFLSDQKKAIDAIYRTSNSQPFAFDAYTIPYNNSQGWDYLFWQYGHSTYGKEPQAASGAILLFLVEQQVDKDQDKLQQFWINQRIQNWHFVRTIGTFGILRVNEYAKN